MIYSRITGTGSYLPAKVMTNADLEKVVDTTDEWIRDRSPVFEYDYNGVGPRIIIDCSSHNK